MANHMYSKLRTVPAGKVLKFAARADREYLFLGVLRNPAVKMLYWFGEGTPSTATSEWVNQPADLRYVFDNGMSAPFYITSLDGSQESVMMLSSVIEDPEIIDRAFV